MPNLEDGGITVIDGVTIIGAINAVLEVIYESPKSGERITHLSE